MNTQLYSKISASFHNKSCLGIGISNKKNRKGKPAAAKEHFKGKKRKNTAR